MAVTPHVLETRRQSLRVSDMPVSTEPSTGRHAPGPVLLPRTQSYFGDKRKGARLALRREETHAPLPVLISGDTIFRGL